MDTSTAIVYSRSRCVRPQRVAIEVIVSSNVEGDSLHIEGLRPELCTLAVDTLGPAFAKAGYPFPQGDVSVIVSDASSCPQEDFRVAMAVGLLVVTKQIPAEVVKQYTFYGQLQADGVINPDDNILSALHADAEEGFVSVLARENMDQFFFLDGARLMGFEQLQSLCEHLQGIRPRSPVTTSLPSTPLPKLPLSLLSLPVSHQTQETLIVAAAGGHGVLQLRQRGTARNAEALALVELIPALGSEWISVAMSQVACGRVVRPDQWGQKPAVLIDEDIDEQTLLGPIPQDHGSQHLGLIAMAQRGVLFINAACGFNARLLTAVNRWREQTCATEVPIREELTQCIVMVSATSCRAGCETHDPFCSCSEQDLTAYHRELGEAAMQCCQVWTSSTHPVSKAPLAPAEAEQISREILTRIAGARVRQQMRSARLNGSLSAEELQRHCKLSNEAEDRLNEHFIGAPIAGARLRALAVALTLADLDQSAVIDRPHIHQALILSQWPITAFAR